MTIQHALNDIGRTVATLALTGAYYDIVGQYGARNENLDKVKIRGFKGFVAITVEGESGMTFVRVYQGARLYPLAPCMHGWNTDAIMYLDARTV